MEKWKLDIKSLCTVRDDAIFHNVADKMESFDKTAVALGVPTPRRQEIKDNYPNDAGMRKIRLLEVWKRSQGSDATYLALVEAFLKMNDRETAEYIVEFVKQQTHPASPDQGTEEEVLSEGHSQGHDEREDKQKGNNVRNLTCMWNLIVVSMILLLSTS